MPRYIRDFLPGATYFFTVNLSDRSTGLLVSEIDRLRASYRAVSRQHPFETVAICVLPDHLHVIWRLPPQEADVALRWSQIKRGFSHGLDSSPPRSSLVRRREKGIWQRRYWEHRIRDEQDFARHVEYIHWNPVKHGLVRQVRDWPYSSFHRWVRDGQIPAQWGLVQAPDGTGGFGERP